MPPSSSAPSSAMPHASATTPIDASTSSKRVASSERIFGAGEMLLAIARTSPSLTAQTSQTPCVMIKSGASARIRSESSVNSGAPEIAVSRTAESTSPGDASPSTRLLVTRGIVRAERVARGGASHSCETATMRSHAPNAAIMSVAAGRSETTRRAPALMRLTLSRSRCASARREMRGGQARER
jgi:hypothetical protein